MTLNSWRRTLIATAVAMCGCRTVPKHECSDDVYIATKPPSNLPARLPNPAYPLGNTGTGSLLGFLADSASGMGIPRAFISVRPDSAAPPPHYTLTDSAGGFWLSDLAPGSHKFYARRIAYDGLEFEATIRIGQVDSVSLRSHPVPVQILCPVTTS